MKVWKGFQKGINLGGWYSQCDYSQERYDNFIQEKDLKEIHEWGADHVRLPVDYNLVQTKDGAWLEEGFARIQQALDWCGKYDLNMVLDLHKTPGYSFDVDEREEGFFEQEDYQERFYGIWEEFARRFGKYQERLAFELLNEVVEKECMDTWNQIADTCIRRIRQICPDIYILVGGYWNNSVAAVKDLAMPQDDKIVYNFHCYEPLVFTHQGASWVKGMPLDFRFSFHHTIAEVRQATEEKVPEWVGLIPQNLDQDRYLDAEYFKAMFAEAIEVAEERNVSLYCGEYGVIHNADPQEALKWFQAIHQALEENGIGRAVWSWREMDYGLKDSEKEAIREEVKKYL